MLQNETLPLTDLLVQNVGPDSTNPAWATPSEGWTRCLAQCAEWPLAAAGQACRQCRPFVRNRTQYAPLDPALPYRAIELVKQNLGLSPVTLATFVSGACAHSSSGEPHRCAQDTNGPAAQPALPNGDATETKRPSSLRHSQAGSPTGQFRHRDVQHVHVRLASGWPRACSVGQLLAFLGRRDASNRSDVVGLSDVMLL